MLEQLIRTRTEQTDAYWHQVGAGLFFLVIDER